MSSAGVVRTSTGKLIVDPGRVDPAAHLAQRLEARPRAGRRTPSPGRPPARRGEHLVRDVGVGALGERAGRTMSLIRGIQRGRALPTPVDHAEDRVGQEVVVEPVPEPAQRLAGRRGPGCSPWPGSGRCAGTSTARRGGSRRRARRSGPAASSQSIGNSCASSVNSGSTAKVRVVRMPSAPRPSRATANTSGFSVAAAVSTSPLPVTSSRPASWALSEATRPPVPWVPVEVAPATVCSAMSPMLCSDSPSASRAGVEHVQRGAGAAPSPSGCSRSTATSPASCAGLSMIPSGAAMPVNEWPVPGILTVVRRSRARCDRRDHVVGVARGADLGRSDRRQPGPVVPGAHAGRLDQGAGRQGGRGRRPQCTTGTRMATMPGPDPYDALLLVSFGGPERPEDVVPFLRNVTAGRDIPDERLVEVGAHYDLFGGRSPINDQNRALLAAIREDLASNGLDLPVYWGNRNWDPYLADALGKMTADGVTRAACLVTSAYSSYSGCRQYRENLADAVAKVVRRAEAGPAARLLQPPGVRRAERRRDPGGTRRVCPTPSAARRTWSSSRTRSRLSMNAASGPVGDAYVHQHRSVMDEISDRVREETGHRYPSTLVYCSRSGSAVGAVARARRERPPRARCATGGCPRVVLVPIGFVSDHMEVVYDLDTEAHGDGRGARDRRANARPPPGSTRGSSRWCATCCSSGPPPSAARTGAGRGRRGPAGMGRVRRRLLREPAWSAPGALRVRTAVTPTDELLDELLDLALDVAREAGELVRPDAPGRRRGRWRPRAAHRRGHRRRPGQRGS